jgi:thioredoxin reductase (NADPH)
MSYIRCYTSRWAIIYTLKPNHDIPGFPEVLAGDLVNNLMEQIKQFEPGFTLGERAETIENKKTEVLL